MMYRNAAGEGPSHSHRKHAQKLAKIESVVSEICSQTDEHPHNRHARHNTPLPYRGTGQQFMDVIKVKVANTRLPSVGFRS